MNRDSRNRDIDARISGAGSFNVAGSLANIAGAYVGAGGNFGQNKFAGLDKKSLLDMLGRDDLPSEDILKITQRIQELREKV